jgi:hypothetical protein
MDEANPPFLLHHPNDIDWRVNWDFILHLAIVPMTVWCVAILHHRMTNHLWRTPELFGHKTVAMLDCWTLQHLCSGVIIGWIAGLRLDWRFPPTTRVEWLCRVLAIAYLWEGHELAGEAGLWGHAAFVWKAGFEHWSNRLIADPLAVTLGAVLFRRVPRALIPALLVTVLWCAVNAATPHCMTVQEWFFGPSSSRVFFFMRA